MKRRKIRISLTLISLIFTLLGIGATALYAYVNIDYYKNFFVSKDIFNMANIIAYGIFIAILFFYTLEKLITRIAMNDKRYFKNVKYQSFAMLYLYVFIWIISFVYLGYVTYVFKIPFSTFCCVASISLLMVITLLYYIDSLAPNEVIDKYMK